MHMLSSINNLNNLVVTLIIDVVYSTTEWMDLFGFTYTQQ